MRYLAIDYGLKRVGVAICDVSETFVSPLCQLTATPKCPDQVIGGLRKIVTENEIEAIIVGLPLNMDGSEGPQVKLTQKFAELLEKEIGLPVEMQDERLSSAAADEMMAGFEFTNKKRKAKRDMLAACDILKEFLNRKGM